MPRVTDLELVDEPVDERTQVIALRGEVDAVTAPKLGRRLFSLAEEGKKGVVLDLSSVTFLDSTGLGVLLNALRQLSQRGARLVLVCPTERVQRPFQVTGLSERLPIFPSREAALGGLA